MAKKEKGPQTLQDVTTETTETVKKERAKKERTKNACGCGCGGETYSTFVPGHDMRYKGMLIRRAREADQTAIDELKQRGWFKDDHLKPKETKTPGTRASKTSNSKVRSESICDALLGIGEKEISNNSRFRQFTATVSFETGEPLEADALIGGSVVEYYWVGTRGGIRKGATRTQSRAMGDAFVKLLIKLWNSKTADGTPGSEPTSANIDVSAEPVDDDGFIDVSDAAVVVEDEPEDDSDDNADEPEDGEFVQD